jgi:FkbM family methyltransferase
MERDLIYDVGLHNGDDTAYYLSKGYRVVAIEADPTLAEDARKRFEKEIAAGKLTLLNIGVGPTEETAQFWISESQREWNSFDKNGACREGSPCYPIEVQCTRFKNILSKYGVPYYLKIDIEGHDRYCLEDLDPDDTPVYLSAEMSSLDQLIILSRLGYDAYKCITQNNHTQLVYPSSGLYRHGPAADKGGERNSNQWKFKFGSSGPFGEETDGEWQTLEECAFAWLAYLLGLTTYGMAGVGTWFDVHCCKFSDVRKKGASSDSAGARFEEHDSFGAWRLSKVRSRNAAVTWAQRTALAKEEIAQLVPTEETLILVDGNELGPGFVPNRRILPFLEREGQYWGAPPDDETAVRELERLRQAGANFIVFAWPAFWWLHYYTGLYDHLRSHYRSVQENDRLVVFDLHQ